MKEKSKCACGKEINKYYFNSTIKRKQCANCELKNLVSGDADSVSKGLYKKRRQTVSKKKSKRVKWKDKPLNEMIQHVQNKFCNPYIRARDKAMFGKCISCNSLITQAGHRYPTGQYAGMRFLINNIHGQEVSCNMYKSGNLDAYDSGLRARHGDEYVENLRQQSLLYKRKRNGRKFTRFDVIEIGITYKYLLENEIWIFKQEAFNEYRNIAML